MHQTIFQREKHPEEEMQQNPLAAIRDPATHQVSTDPKTMLDIVHRHFQNLLNPTHVIKTGRYMPQDRPPDLHYPFQDPANPDNYELTHGISDPEESDLLELLSDRATYNDRLRHIRHGKTPGPDQIPNELLKALPDDWHSTIHRLFVILWVTGDTPYSWKESTTTLLHRKDDPTLVANYRPIGLANTLYKLWTSNVAYILMHHSIRHNIIHKCQEGGITCRDTRRQLRNLINSFEDAHHSKQDLYCLYVDFSNAFNMVDHDKLLSIMHDIGLPIDATEVVKGMYHDNRTLIHIPAGSTPPVNISRGTVQGDPLSPLLFLFYIEPLLRWLHVGGRGYKYGCLRDKQDQSSGLPLQDIHYHAASGFIDDTTALTHTRPDMQAQTRKIETYATWAGMPVNSKKCAVTAILHGEASTRPRGSAINQERIASLLTLSNALKISGEPIPYLPPTEPYKYLGVYCCPAMVWDRQLQTTIADTLAKGRKLAASLASPRQCLHILQTVIKPSISYAFCVAPYTLTQLALLDKVLAGIARKCCRLQRSFPTCAILRHVDEGGIGLISLSVEYAQISTACLVRAHSDPGMLGMVTRELLNTQRDKMGGAPVEEITDGEARFCTGLRQLAIMARHDIQLVVMGTPYDQTPPHQNTLYSQDGGRLTALLRSQSVSPALMHPLQELGIQHVGELVTDAGTHLISTSDLQQAYGPAVKHKHKQALNKLSIALSQTLSQLEPPVTLLSQVRTTAALPPEMRALPADLVQPQGNAHRRRAAGTKDIRELLTQNTAPPLQTSRPAVSTSQDAPRPQRQRRTRRDIQAATHSQMAREGVAIGAHSLTAFQGSRGEPRNHGHLLAAAPRTVSSA